MKTIFFSLTLVLLSICHATSLNAQVSMNVESGYVFSGYNNVRIPGDKGTLFSLKNDLKSDAMVFYRLRASYTVKSRHTFSVLYAPLETQSAGSVAKSILFEGVVFPANVPLNGIYKFNSYRLTYRYDLIKRPGFDFGLGFTAKIRDAKIGLSSQGLTAEKTNVGFVPIINFRLWWKMNNKLGLLLEGDALAAPQGRAEDVLIAATYKLSKNLGLFTGYRILEGGSDNDVVYNFALFHYASVGLTCTFNRKAKSN